MPISKTGNAVTSKKAAKTTKPRKVRKASTLKKSAPKKSASKSSAAKKSVAPPMERGISRRLRMMMVTTLSLFTGFRFLELTILENFFKNYLKKLQKESRDLLKK